MNMNKKIGKELMLRNIKDLGKILILMLDEVAVIVVILLILHFLGIPITLAIKIGAGIAFVIFVFIRHVAVIPSFHRKQITGREGMIGLQGKVVEPLNPVGTIIVKGEHWKAKSIYENIDINEKVEVMGVNGLMLMVKPRTH